MKKLLEGRREESVISQINIDKENCLASGNLTVSLSELDLISSRVMKSTRGKSQAYQQYEFDRTLDSFIKDRIITSKVFGEILEWKGESRIRISRDRNISLGERAPLICHVECDVFPELPELSFPKIEEPKIEINEKDIDNQIEKIFYENRVEIEKNELIEEGDLIRFTFEFIHDKGSQKDEEEKSFLVSQTMDKQMLEKLLKSKVGDVIENEISVPSADELKTHPYRDELISVAGQKTKGRIHLNKVMKLVNPELPDLLKKLEIDSEEELRNRVREVLKGYAIIEANDYKISQISDHLREYNFNIPSMCIEESIDPMLESLFSELNLRYDRNIYSDQKFQADFMETVSSKNDFYKDKSFEDFMEVVRIFARKNMASIFMVSKLKEFTKISETDLRNLAIRYLMENQSKEEKNLEYFTNNMNAAQKYVLMIMSFEKLKADGETFEENYSSISEFRKKIHDYSRHRSIIYFNEGNK